MSERGRREGAWIMTRENNDIQEEGFRVEWENGEGSITLTPKVFLRIHVDKTTHILTYDAESETKAMVIIRPRDANGN